MPKIQLTVWDVGGCDKIRPLWRHYYQNTQGIIFIVDSNDRERMNSDSGYGESSSEMLAVTLQEDELRDAVVLIFYNKQDLPNARSPAEMDVIYNIEGLRRQGRIVHSQPCCATSGDGLLEGFTWLQNAFIQRRDPGDTTTIDASFPSPPPPPPQQRAAPVKPIVKAVITAEEEAQQRIEKLLVEWLEREDESDEEFLANLRNYTLENWDHRTHLRIAWLILSKHDRREGLPMIFDLIKNFIAHSPRTQRSRGTTFHETMTYFWVHMVHYAMVATRLPKNDFKTFLLMNPQMANGGLFLHYYSKQRMLRDADARIMVLLSDKTPLPSMISSKESHIGEIRKVTADALGNSAGVRTLVPSAPLTDTEFLVLLGRNALPGWGHDTKLRIIYLLLCKYGRSSACVDYILAQLAVIEKANAHLTLNYFWIQMVTYHIAAEMKSPTSRTAGPAVIFNAFNNKNYMVPALPSAISASSDTALQQPIGTADAVADLAGNTAKLALQSEESNMPFGTFIQLPHCQPLRNQLLYEKYYSRSVIDDANSASALALPNLKQLPQLV